MSRSACRERIQLRPTIKTQTPTNNNSKVTDQIETRKAEKKIEYDAICSLTPIYDISKPSTIFVLIILPDYNRIFEWFQNEKPIKKIIDFIRIQEPNCKEKVINLYLLDPNTYGRQPQEKVSYIKALDPNKIIKHEIKDYRALIAVDAYDAPSSEKEKK